MFGRASQGGANRDVRDFRIMELAGMLALAQVKPERATGTPDLFQHGWKSPIYLRVHITPTWQEALNLYEDSFTVNAMVPLGGLPAAYRQRLLNEVAVQVKGDWTFNEDGTITRTVKR